tara:strand:+ start:206 stop:382 length:177 start_codon:yes stop_codon:yes gene_type:complete
MIDKSPDPLEKGISKLASLIEEPSAGIHEAGFSHVNIEISRTLSTVEGVKVFTFVLGK